MPAQTHGAVVANFSPPRMCQRCSLRAGHLTASPSRPGMDWSHTCDDDATKVIDRDKGGRNHVESFGRWNGA